MKNSGLLFLFAHGAGAGSAHPWMRHWAKLLRTIGKVRLMEYPYMAAGNKRPDRLPQLIAAHRAALAKARKGWAGPIVLIGKSMGGRVGCHVALEEPVAAVVCLGYPLCAGGDCAKMRDAVLRELSTPVLFLQGTRDPLCPLETFRPVLREITTAHDLFVVEGGDHSLMVTKAKLRSAEETQEAVDRRILEVIRAFVTRPSRQSGR